MSALTSVRFFAALYVVLYHTFGPANPNAPGWIARIVGMGYCSVSFFYTLSGFIMGAVYLRTDPHVNVLRFYVARFARIYPLFMVTLLLDVPNLLLDRIAKYGVVSACIKTAITLVGSSLMLHGWWLKLRGLDNPNWSVAVEVVFYVLFPFAGPLIWKRSRGAVLATIIVLFAVEMLPPTLGPYIGIQIDLIKFTPIMHLHEFAIGLLAARLYFGQTNGRTATGLLRAPSVLAILGITTCAIAVLMSGSIPQLLIHNGLLAPAYALVIVGLASSEANFSRVLSWSPLVLLGEASYSLYLLHIPFWKYYARIGITHSAVAYWTYLTGVIAASIFTYLRFEAPARTLLLQRFTGRQDVVKRDRRPSSAWVVAAQRPGLLDSD